MYTRTTTIGNKLLLEYTEVLLEAMDDKYIMPVEGLLRESDEELIDTHLFNLTQAEIIIEPLNRYLQNEISVGKLLGFLNAEAECMESMNLTVKEKKQRYVIIIVNALASTLWRHPIQQKRFLSRCRWQIGIDSATWDTQTSRIRNATGHKRNVSSRALQLRDELYEQLGIPIEHRM